TGTPNSAVVDGVKGAEVVYLAFDADDAGRKATQKKAKALAEAGITVIPVGLPDGLDLADWLVTQDDPGRALPNLLADAEASIDSPGIDQSGDTEGSSKGRQSQATQLVEMTDGTVEFFRSPGEAEAYASISAGDHRETWPLRSRGFKDWLRREHYGQKGGVPG